MMHRSVWVVFCLGIVLASGLFAAENTGEVDSGLRGVPERGASKVKEDDGCWQPGFFLEDLDGSPEAFAVFDDGSGPALFVGGFFRTADGIAVNSIAKWDGTSWSSPRGPSGEGIGGEEYDPPAVYALEVYDDGSGPALFAAGSFLTAGGFRANNIAKWNGRAWSPLIGPSVSGMNNIVTDLAVYDDGTGEALFAVGSFSFAGGIPANHIVKWDGSSWSALNDTGGLGLDSYALDLSVYDDGTGEALYVGGAFTNAGGIVANHIARWDGTTWSALSGPSGIGVAGRVETMAVFDDGTGVGLFVAGAFTEAGGITVNHIAKWDGTTWSQLIGSTGIGVNGAVLTLAIYDDGGGEALFAGGGFEWVDGIEVNRVVKWDGLSWSALSGPSGMGVEGGMSSAVNVLGVFDDGSGEALFAGGSFDTAGGVLVNHIAQWNGGFWSPLGEALGAGIIGEVMAFTTFEDDNGPLLYAGGDFFSAGGVIVNNIAAWDGTSWSALIGSSGTGLNGEVNALAVFDDGTGEALYAGGNGIAKWEGDGWSGLEGVAGEGVDHYVYALALFDDGMGEALYVGGKFWNAGGSPAFHIAKWDGTSWSDLNGPLGSGTNGDVLSLVVFDDGSGEALYVGGSFGEAGGVSVSGIAKWDGAEWSRPCGSSGDCLGGQVKALAVFDDGNGSALYAGGDLNGAGGLTLNDIGKWDGNIWSALSGPSGFGTDRQVTALTVYDDGTGEALYVGGWFENAGGVEVNHVARWDGAQWSALSGPSDIGVTYRVNALSVFADGFDMALFAGGDFNGAGGWSSKSIAKWGRGCKFPIFADGFETGTTGLWSDSLP
jgi:hypothetical protein